MRPTGARIIKIKSAYFRAAITLIPPLFPLADGDPNEKNICRRTVGSHNPRGCQELLRTVWTGELLTILFLHFIRKILGAVSESEKGKLNKHLVI